MTDMELMQWGGDKRGLEQDRSEGKIRNCRNWPTKDPSHLLIDSG